MNILKILSIVIVFALIPHLACTNESKQVQSQAATLAANNTETSSGSTSTASANVYNIKEVKKAVGNKVADFTFDQNGKTVSFAELTKGKVVFLNFWGTWCPPCRREIPDIVAISKELQGKDFIVIGIALEKGQPENRISKVAEFAKSNSITYNLIIGNQEIAQAYGGISSVPTTYIIDKDGTIGETIIGMRDKESFLKSINKFLK